MTDKPALTEDPLGLALTATAPAPCSAAYVTYTMPGNPEIPYDRRIIGQVFEVVTGGGYVAAGAARVYVAQAHDFTNALPGDNYQPVTIGAFPSQAVARIAIAQHLAAAANETPAEDDQSVTPEQRHAWAPAERALAAALLPNLMFMGVETDADGTTVHQYKHRDTRRYINLAEDGQAYRVELTAPNGQTSDPDAYVVTLHPVTLEWALAELGDNHTEVV